MFTELVSGWSPYGLEGVRRKALRVRLLKAIAAVIGVYLAVAMYFALTVEEDYMTTQFGTQDQGEQEEGGEEQRDRPVRVTLSPGRAAFSNMQDEGSTEGTPRVRPLPRDGLDLRWLNLLQLVGVYAGIYGLFAKVARSGIHAQVNFGVFKGAMPYELHSQTLRRRLFSHKKAKYSLALLRRSEYYARIAPDFPSLFWKRLLEGEPLQAPVVEVRRPGRTIGKAARPV